MNKYLIRIFVGMLSLIFVLSACGPFQLILPTQVDQGVFHTQAVQTLIAQLTNAVALFTPTPTATSTTAIPILPTDTPTLVPPTATYTQIIPSATATVTNTPVPPTKTPIPPTPTPTPIPCNWAKFLADVTIKDGSKFTPNSVITKIWKLQNIGTCTWTENYKIVFVDGKRMEGPKSMALPEKVKPGETIDLGIELIAPDDEGKYRGYWQLKSDDDELFGIGKEADSPFWVEIRVVMARKYAYDFTANYCQAVWRSSAGRLPCPGNSSMENGFVIQVEDPIVEIGRQENETALWTNPHNTRDGWISGEFPEFRVMKGDSFKAVVGCLDKSSHCDVIFQLNYRIDGGAEQTLWETQEEYDDNFTKVDVDLAPLIGQNVKFILKVLAHGSPRDDRAFWLVPRIVR